MEEACHIHRCACHLNLDICDCPVRGALSLSIRSYVARVACPEYIVYVIPGLFMRRDAQLQDYSMLTGEIYVTD